MNFPKVATGLQRLIEIQSLSKSLSGNIAFLCHNASVDSHCHPGIFGIRQLFGRRLKAIFSPQHGLFGAEQDNMIESPHFFHPNFELPVYSLYADTRQPTEEMLQGIDHVVVDLQDIGSRAYTYLYTLTLLMEICGKMDIEVVVLDRPNPIGGIEVEGNMLEPAFTSFIGRHPLPMRHGMTLGELSLMAQKYWMINCPLRVFAMQGWDRQMHFGQTHLPWVNPSPNIAHIKTTWVFPGMVLWEGTNLSEGRGTVRPFEHFGHPKLDPYVFLPIAEQVMRTAKLSGFVLRPTYFVPTFEKHQDISCGGFQLHLIDRTKFRPWRTGQVLCQAIYHHLGEIFQWRQPPFEYEDTLLPIDMLNGTDKLRHWVENGGSMAELEHIEIQGRDEFLEMRQSVMLY